MSDGPLPPPRSTPIPSTQDDARGGGQSAFFPPPGGGTAPTTDERPVMRGGPLWPEGTPTTAAPKRARRSGSPWWMGLLLAAATGALLLAFVDPLLPRRSEPARVTDRDIERSTRRSNGRTRTTTRHVVEGRTDDGDTWEIVSRDLYDDVAIGDRVTVEFSRLSGGAVSVDGPGYEFDKAKGWLRYLFLAGALLFGGLGVAVRPGPGPARVKWAVGTAVGLVVGAIGIIWWL